MEVKKEFVLRNIAGDFVLVPLGKTAAEFNGIFPLTETAARIFELLPEAKDENDIVSRIYDEFDCDLDTIKGDVSQFLNKLREYGII